MTRSITPGLPGSGTTSKGFSDRKGDPDFKFTNYLVVSTMFYFHPENWVEDESTLTAYFSEWVGSTTNQFSFVSQMIAYHSSSPTRVVCCWMQWPDDFAVCIGLPFEFVFCTVSFVGCFGRITLF